jgi:murein DD-endopeptidase MepM/ murein hydrolase activator NlpD
VRKAHLGIDYAAPTGTPVRTVGDGSVTFAGWQRGYGNVVIVEHKGQQSTLYAHLSRIHVSKGQRISQGDSIGAVGSTGASTGPHLHFEYRVKGEHLDPLTIARNSESITIDGRLRPVFESHATQMREKLAAAYLLQQASAQ